MSSAKSTVVAGRGFLGHQARHVVWVALASLALVATPRSQAPAAGQPAPRLLSVRWRTGEVSVAAEDHARAFETLMNLAADPAQSHVLVQLNRTLTSRDKDELDRAGLVLLEPLGDDAYFAGLAIDRLQPEWLLGYEALARAESIRPEWKAEGQLLDCVLPKTGTAPAEFPPHARVPGSTGTVGLYVVFHGDTSETRRLTALAAVGATPIADVWNVRAYVVLAPAARVADLIRRDEVQYVELPLPAMHAGMDKARDIVRADEVMGNVPLGTSEHIANPYELTGKDPVTGKAVAVMVYDTCPADAAHPDFGNRVTNNDLVSHGYFTYPFIFPPKSLLNPMQWDPTDPGHGTNVAGIVGGSGLMSVPTGRLRGIAPECKLEVYSYESPSYDAGQLPGGNGSAAMFHDPGDLLWDVLHGVQARHVEVLTASLVSAPADGHCAGTGQSPGLACKLFGNYGIASAVIDGIVRGDAGKPLPVVWCVGNDRGMLNDPTACPSGQKPCGNGFFDDSLIGDMTTIGPPGSSKNPTIVGSIDRTGTPLAIVLSIFTSTGPTDDGRIKPDLVAPGDRLTLPFFEGFPSNNPSLVFEPLSGPPFYYVGKISGTSYAAPVVAGIEALVIQYHRKLAADDAAQPVQGIFWDGQFHSTDPSHVPPLADLLPSTVKALLIHNATDLQTQLGAQEGPDMSTGWGLVNAQATIQFMDRNDSAGRTGFYYEGAVSPVPQYGSGPAVSMHKVKLSVAAGTEVRVTLVWDDPPATPNAAKTLVNDLNLHLIAPNGTVFKTWNVTGPDEDTINNVEQVLVKPAQTASLGGTWTIEVSGAPSALSGQQWFSVCASASSSSPLMLDCNGNGVSDSDPGEASASGIAGVPDVCEPDCNADGIPDKQEIASHLVADYNNDGVPDDCEPVLKATALQQQKCADAMLVCAGAYLGSTFYGEQISTSEHDCTDNASNRVWYRYKPAVNLQGNLDLTVVNDGDPNDPGYFGNSKWGLAVYERLPGQPDPCANILAAPSAVPIACDYQVSSGFGGPTAHVNVPLNTNFQPGVEYLIAVASGPETNFKLTVVAPQCDAGLNQGYECQTNLGFGKAGAGVLSVCGPPLEPGAIDTLRLFAGAPGAAATMFVGPVFAPTPFKGGILVPVPPSVLLACPLNAIGNFAMPLPGIPLSAPLPTYFQMAYPDASATQNVNISNAVMVMFLP